MEAAVAGVGKSMLNCLLSGAKDAIDEDVATKQVFQRDLSFLREELDEMYSFLVAADEDWKKNNIPRSRLKQVRDLSRDVEDCLEDFSVHAAERSWWRLAHARLERHRIAQEMKGLRARAEDMTQRNLRWRHHLGEDDLIMLKPPPAGAMAVVQQQSVSAHQLFGLDGTRHATNMKKAKVDLVQLVNKEENDLRVIAVWGTSVDLGQTSIIRAAYDNPDVKRKFPCRAWVRLTHPFNPKNFIHSSVKQFERAAGANSLLGTEKTSQELADEFNGYVNENRYLIVLNNLSTIEDWDQVEKCFPNNKMGSRIIVSTSQVDVASLCAGQECIVSGFKQLSADPNIYAFYDKGSQDGTDFTKTEESHVVGRVKEKNDIIKLITNQATQQFQVISVWGKSGIGKTTLIKDVYQSQELNGTFEKRACVTITHPFNLEELLRSLVMQLDRESSEKKRVISLRGSTKNTLLLMPLAELIKELARLINNKSCLIVLDDVSYRAEWNVIIPVLPEMENNSRIIVTTRERSTAKHCSKKDENMYMLRGLEDKDAHDLFTKKVFGKNAKLDEQYPVLVEEANQILRICDRLPLAIVTIGGFLANQPKTILEWRKLNKHIIDKLEMNPDFIMTRIVLLSCYDGLPYHLKSCFLYMSIFPEDFKIGRSRLVRRWAAEGYPREVLGKSVQEISDGYFMELISRSMILPSQQSIHSINRIDSCQVHDLMREIGILKSAEENLVFSLDEYCSSNTMGARHIAIKDNWKGDQTEFESIVDMSRVRSITVFGEWRPFFISDKMSMLRVLDLEDTTGLHDRNIKHIGKLLHLKYLSLRGCNDVFHLPDSLGNLRQLETLDVRGTEIIKLPKSIIKLEKLIYLCAGKKSSDEDVTHERAFGVLPEIMRNKLCFPFSSLPLVCLACRQLRDEDGMNHRDKCTSLCCSLLPALAMQLDLHGVVVPSGMRKLKALRALAVVNISQGKNIVKDIKGLTQLRKLGVTGINKKNGQEFCSAISALSRLESLSIQSEGKPGLHGCLDGMFSPPELLWSLKLYGNLVKLPAWIKELKYLVKLKLRSTELSDAKTTMEVLGNLPYLHSLHLLCGWLQFQLEENMCLNFEPGMFPMLSVLELTGIHGSRSVKFEGAARSLELLKFAYSKINSNNISGLPYLWSLREVVALQGVVCSPTDLEWLGAELAKNKNKPAYKMV